MGSGVQNGDGSPVDDLFGWPMPDGTGAGGSNPQRATPPDGAIPDQVTGVPGAGVIMSLSAQTGSGSSASPEMPGQNDLGIPGAEHEDGYVNSGAGDGVTVSASSHGRLDYQQPAQQA